MPNSPDVFRRQRLELLKIGAVLVRFAIEVFAAAATDTAAADAVYYFTTFDTATGAAETGPLVAGARGPGLGCGGGHEVDVQ